MQREIPILYNPSTFLHRPQWEIFNGERKPHQDTPQRAQVILEELSHCGFADIQVSRANEILPIVSQVHDQDYLGFLDETSQLANRQATRDSDPNKAIYPTIHPYVSYARASNSISKRGQHVFDTYTPIMKNTYEVAVDSAGVAIAGAMLLRGGEPLVYSLNRPPGHHALKGMAGGMCYLNNTAIAASYLKAQEDKKIAILDIDIHHGNGTQDIYYEDPEVLVINIHVDPIFKFPHFTGYTDERGSCAGHGMNHNFPLPMGTNNQLYEETAAKALEIIRDFQPEYLLVSAGFDTHENDPIGAFKLTTPYYEELGRHIRGLDMPTLVVQEGGYATQNLGLNVVSFLKGLIRN